MLHEVPLERWQGLDPARGLASAEVAERRRLYGANLVLEVAGGRWRALARDTAADPMLWFLVATGGLYALLSDWAEALVLWSTVVPLALMDAWLHRRTQASLRALEGGLAARARVERDGRELELASEELVPGDVVRVGAEESFPADGVLLAAEDCQADESMLTGESFPARKAPAPALPVAGGASPGLDSAHWGFAGTRLLTGHARMRVAFTGAETIYGSIVRAARLGPRARTPLQQSIAGLVRALVIAATILCATLALVRYRQGHGALDALVSALTLAVAALPEEFPVVFAVFLGVGVYRLARRKALVRRAVSVENVGRVTAICTDKTGTLTWGRLALAHTVPEEGPARARLLATAAGACRPGSGDPLDRAVLAAAAGMPRPEVLEHFPFTEDRRRETVLVRAQDGGVRALVKGSPETVLDACALAPSERARWEARVAGLAADGHRVIACAARTLDARAPGTDEPAHGFALEGLLAFEDPLRPGVREALAACHRAGVRALVVTGDHPATALAIAREVGLGGGAPELVLGAELDAYLRAPGALARLDVVARALPAHKLALVRALAAAGEIVAVTGDGVNDVPALQAADVGIAMGRGTRSAREVAAIVLSDDDFGTLVGAIAEGRQLFRNLQKSFLYLLMIHVPLVLTAAVIPLAGYPLVFLPIHIVWLELLIHPTAMLVFQELPTPDVLTPVPRRRAGAFFARREWAAIALVGGLLTLGIVWAYDRGLGAGRAVEHARAMVLVTLSLASVAVLSFLSGLGTRLARGIALASLALALLLVQVPALAARLHLVPLHADDWALAALLALVACAPALLTRPGRGRAAHP